jgi:hypothetical protein
MQTLVTLKDGQQVAIMQNDQDPTKMRVMQRQGPSDMWSIPLAEGELPHQAGSFYQGSW